MVHFEIAEVAMVLVKMVEVTMVQVNMFENPAHRAINYVSIWLWGGLRYLVEDY